MAFRRIYKKGMPVGRLMLTKFAVANFMNFKDRITFDLSEPCNYGFNDKAVRDGCITKGVVYGPNGSGKSNLGLAVFDLILHLTDREKLLSRYDCYLNMDSPSERASFSYEFIFGGKKVVYQYEKTNPLSLLTERLFIGEKEVIFYDFIRAEGYTVLKGAETLNMVSKENPISRVKYIKSNAILEDNEENRAFYDFTRFVDNMLLFYSLDQRGYQGFQTGSESITEGIIKSGHTEDFERFLREQGIDYHLKVRMVDGKESLYCQFKEGEANFFTVASTGTISLALFYYWYVKMSSASFVFIDEFDAFYHYELARDIVQRVCELDKTQVILTTHNTDLMSNDLLRPDCYFQIKSGKIQPLSSLTDRELRKAHNLQKMYKAGVFNE